MQNAVLVVEDDLTIQEVISEYLADAGFKVLTADNGKDANDMIDRNDAVDLFILDIMLPRVSGIELLKTIRASVSFKEKPVIMLTALNDEYTQLACFQGLADDYVTKPFSPRILVKRVEALLRRSGTIKSTLQIGHVSIDVDAYEAYENGDRIILTLKELEILKVLMNNNQKVLSRQQLLNLVWGYDYFGDERIVDVHIKNLRKKFKSNMITTVKGVGYKITSSSAGGGLDV